jgi:hypothetical protein
MSDISLDKLNARPGNLLKNAGLAVRQSLELARHEHEVGTRASVEGRDGEADAARGPGDEDGFAFERL